MNYRIWLLSVREKVKQEIEAANKKLLMNDLSIKVFDVVFQLTDNDKFSYQVATDFSFERILNSKEFSEEEKEVIKNLELEFKNL